MCVSMHVSSYVYEYFDLYKYNYTYIFITLAVYHRWKHTVIVLSVCVCVYVCVLAIFLEKHWHFKRVLVDFKLYKKKKHRNCSKTFWFKSYDNFYNSQLRFTTLRWNKDNDESKYGHIKHFFIVFWRKTENNM